MSAVCCVLPVVCCLSSAVSAVCSLLSTVCVVCYLLFAVCFLLSAICCLFSALSCLQPPLVFPHAITIWHYCCAQYQALYWAPLYPSLVLEKCVNSLLGKIHSCPFLSHPTPTPTSKPPVSHSLPLSPPPQPSYLASRNDMNLANCIFCISVITSCSIFRSIVSHHVVNCHEFQAMEDQHPTMRPVRQIEGLGGIPRGLQLVQYGHFFVCMYVCVCMCV
jgi:hypothetical protein